ncbi:hypothetical protein [Companilactobacillus mishanensis]|uniref:Uncharacterized protein n=1 Tax=Companilactobacillus mishanensis TaxID=2486008 RepID=A0ABW9P5W1_9LACO|nr:hypothetical protein [Companilactobacillus mishanensis]MQS44615.1 hypothetical protein [Companilactobacillus mishanensis]
MLKNYLEINQKAKNLIETSPMIVTQTRDAFEYQDGQRTEKTTGINVSGVIIEGDISGEEIKIKCPSTTKAKVGSKVLVKIENSRVYAKTQRNSNFANVEVSLTGSIKNVNSIIEKKD